ncbi:MAG: class I SAM-dependent methyltransferase [Saprospiraceae bacterium]
MEKTALITFYDHHVQAQVDTGVNERHHAILRFLQERGLRGHHQLLEVGCGIGTLTGLLAKQLTRGGQLTAVDISPKSVETARRRLRNRSNVRFLTGDILQLNLEQRFDVVVLPDVLEHIPLEEHSRLFQRLQAWLQDDGFIFIHVPEPRFLAWSQIFEPENLQIVDQPIYTDRLLANAYPAGLYLDYLRSYSLWRQSPDYQVIVLKHDAAKADYTVQKRSWHRRWRGKLKRLWREGLSR